MLPNITGYLNGDNGGYIDTVTGQTGALNVSVRGTTASINSGEQGRNNIGFNASASNSIFGKSSTVQTASVQLLMIIKV